MSTYRGTTHAKNVRGKCVSSPATDGLGKKQDIEATRSITVAKRPVNHKGTA